MHFLMLYCVHPELYFGWHSQFSVNSLFQKKNKWEIEDILSWKLPLEFLGFLFYPRKFQKKQSFTLKLHKILLHPLEILRPKIKTPGNSIWFFLSWSPLKIPYCFYLTPRNFTLNFPLVWFFFGIAQRQVIRWFTYLAIFVDIRYVGLKF